MPPRTTWWVGNCFNTERNGDAWAGLHRPPMRLIPLHKWKYVSSRCPGGCAHVTGRGAAGTCRGNMATGAVSSTQLQQVATPVAASIAGQWTSRRAALRVSVLRATHACVREALTGGRSPDHTYCTASPEPSARAAALPPRQGHVGGAAPHTA